MSFSAGEVFAAHDDARGGRATGVVPRVAEALPRRLQACMQELLCVNERYHALLQSHSEQGRQLEAAKSEVQQLSAELAQVTERAKAQAVALERSERAAEDLREVGQSSGARCSAAESECSELHGVVKRYAERLLKAETALSEATQRSVEAEAWLAAHWQSGFEEGVKKQQAETKSKLARARQKAQEEALEAFERGKQASDAEASSRQRREQAERRLLLHRAEQARHQQKGLEASLAGERHSKAAAEGRSADLAQRLRSVRHQKGSLQGQLDATRAAHRADLAHFEEMESALGVACGEYAALASRRHAEPPPGMGAGAGAGAGGMRTPPRSASPPREAVPGCSPPEAMRTRAPRPAAFEAAPLVPMAVAARRDP